MTYLPGDSMLADQKAEALDVPSSRQRLYDGWAVGLLRVWPEIGLAAC
ncbi:hypothetical protein K7W42_07840 [Deinococcus sp. HMF7604]|nr:hypothetical protein [Deinococcus betulae]MBZ9750771.1 hypothetical protein [Deinococcus betulae]